MTNTNERERARPVEVVARAIAADIEAAFPVRLAQTWDQLTPLARATMRARADAILNTLVSHGFLNEQYFLAREAEEKAAESLEERGLSMSNQHNGTSV